MESYMLRASCYMNMLRHLDSVNALVIIEALLIFSSVNWDQECDFYHVSILLSFKSKS